MNFPLVSRLLGVVMLILAMAFGLCFGVSLAMDRPDDSTHAPAAFIGALGTALFAAGLLFWAGRGADRKFHRKEALCTIGLGWILTSIVGAIPYLVLTPHAGMAGAIFESASGLTTTGASVLTDLEQLPPSLLFWRSLSQWIGGMGVVVFFVAILGFLGAGAKILYANEASGSVADFDESRVQSTVARLIYTYVALSTACVGAYWIAGMNLFEAVNHAFATVSTGGFSTRTASMADFESPAIEWIAIIFMTAGGVSFLLILRLAAGNFARALRDTEMLAYLGALFVSSMAIAAILIGDDSEPTVGQAIRAATFQAVSVMTTTGFATEDYAQWATLPQALLLALMVVGGCSGSTSGGLKVARVVVAFRIVVQSVERSFRSRVVRQIRINHRVLSAGATNDIMTFLVTSGAVAACSIVFVAVLEPDIDLDTALSMVLACLFNVGPGLAAVGPMETFAFLQPHTKAFLSLLMIMGRLELYAILALFAPPLWRRFS